MKIRFGRRLAIIAAAVCLWSLGAKPATAHNDSPRYRTIDFPNSRSITSVRGVNCSGTFVGYFNDADGKLHGFIGTVGRNGRLTQIDYPGAAQTLALGINDWGVVAGTYFDTGGVQHGFVRIPASSPRRDPRWITLDVPVASVGFDWFFEFGNGMGTSAWGINNWGDVVGQYADEDGIGHGFVLRNGRFHKIDVPRAFEAPGSDGGTLATRINNWGEVAGAFGGTKSDNSLIRLGFVRSGNRYYPLAPAGSIYTQAYTVTDRGLVGGAWVDANFVMHGFLLSRGRFTTIDAPGSAGITLVLDAHEDGGFVGEFVTADGKTHGFLATRR
jgi:hypothetical protein